MSFGGPGGIGFRSTSILAYVSGSRCFTRDSSAHERVSNPFLSFMAAPRLLVDHREYDLQLAEDALDLLAGH